MGSSARFRYSASAFVILLGANPALSAQRSTAQPSVGVIPVLGQWDHAVEGTIAAGDLRVEHTLDRAIGGRVGLWTKRDSITAFRSWRAG